MNLCYASIKENLDEKTQQPELKNTATRAIKETGHLISYM